VDGGTSSTAAGTRLPSVTPALCDPGLQDRIFFCVLTSHDAGASTIHRAYYRL